MIAFGEADASAPFARARRYAFRIGEERWIEESFVHLDRVLAAARARGLRVIVVLANRWEDYGGIPRYLQWTEPEATPIDPLAEADLTPFWRSERAAALYLAHVWGEIGIPARHPRLAPRAAWFDAFSRHAFATGASGVLTWIYGPPSLSPHRISPGDPASDAVRSVQAAHAARLR